MISTMSTSTMPIHDFGLSTEQIGSTAAVASAVVLGLHQLIKRFGDARKDVANASKEVAQVDAQTSVMNRLHDELARLSDQNARLATCLNTLQIEVINLRGENTELRTTIRHLHAEVKRLRKSGAVTDFAGLPMDDDETASAGQ